MSDVTAKESMESIARREKYENSFEDMLKPIKQAVGFFAEAKSCLALGCGAGFAEINVMKTVLPNVLRFVAVEPDHASIIQLQENCKTLIPETESKAVEAMAQDIGDTAIEPVDVILMIHVLYHFNEEDRRAIFARIPKWLTRPEGRLYIVTAVPGKSKPSLFDLYDRIGKSMSPWDTIVEELAAVGLKKEFQSDEKETFDASDPDPQLITMFKNQAKAPESMPIEEIKKVMAEVYPDGVSNNIISGAVFKFA